MATVKPYKNTGIKYLSEEWETQRRVLGIGGSEASAIVGFNPYSSAFSVYCDKIGKGEQKPISEALRQGSDLEDYVAQRFCEETGKKVKRNGFMLQSIAHPFMLADVDRFIVGENALLECKCTLNSQGYSYEDANNIPAYHLVQCLHYMSVVGAEKAYLATLVYGRGFYVVEINRDDYKDDIAALIEMEERFWNENVKAQIAPLADGSESSSESLKAAYPQADETISTVDLTLQETSLNRLSEIKAQIKALSDEQTGIENLIKQTLGEASKGENSHYKVIWSNYESTRLDTKALKADLPEVYARYAKTSMARKFLVTEKKQ